MSDQMTYDVSIVNNGHYVVDVRPPNTMFELYIYFMVVDKPPGISIPSRYMIRERQRQHKGQIQVHNVWCW